MIQHLIGAGLMMLMLVSCSSIGSHDPTQLKSIDFGPEASLRICVLLDEPEISEAEGRQIMQAVRDEMALYKIQIVVPWYLSWQRPGLVGTQIIENLADKKLSPPCDRIFALVGRNLGDVVIGLVGVQTLGAVDTVTHTRGYVISEFTGINQIISPPEAAAVHESYHLLGCDHALAISQCYLRIQALKNAALQNRAQGNDFFPTYSRTGRILFNRSDVDIREALALRIQRENRQPMP